MVLLQETSLCLIHPSEKERTTFLQVSLVRPEIIIILIHFNSYISVHSIVQNGEFPVIHIKGKLLSQTWGK